MSEKKDDKRERDSKREVERVSSFRARRSQEDAAFRK